MKELKELKQPIQPHEIQWRVQSKGNGKTTVVPYLTNRCVMERFDKQFGAENWQNTFEEWRSKGVKCGISVRTDLDNWVTKFDGADETAIESTKGGFSDSMKRAAVQWGLGRDLYDYPMIQIEGEFKYIPNWASKQLYTLSENASVGAEMNEYYLIKQVSQQVPKPKKQTVVIGDQTYLNIVKAVAEGKGTIEQAKKKYAITSEVEKSIKEKVQALATLG
jgi:hypothetical protein